VVERARKHIGEDYKFVNVPKDDASWRGPWDCAEFVSWLVYQEAGVLYGCDDDKGNPHTADAWTGHWKRDIETRGIGVSVAKAAATVGGILLRFPPNVPVKFGHIVVSDGHVGTIEAMGKASGVRAASIAGRQWDAGILLPELSYDGLDTTAPDLPGPSRIFAIDAQNMNPLVIERIQRALKANGFDPGDVDGKLGPKMEAAVVAFQDAKGLVVDGDVGEETAESLGIGLAPITIEAAEARPAAAAPSAPDISVQRSLEPMGPLIPIALQLLPGLVGLIAGDKSGAIQDSIAKAVTDIAGTTDAVAARQKIDADPAAASELRVKLAQIAADAEDKRNQAQLAALKAQQDAQFATLKSQQDAEASRRSDELDRFKAALQDTEAARSQAYAASQAGGPAAWAPIIISLIVTIGFFATFFYLVFILRNDPAIDPARGTFQLVNLTLGALVAAFTTVVSFWLGSSQGSRLKDVATADAQVAQTRELNQTLRTQTETLQKTQSESLDAVRQTSARIGAAARPQAGAAAVRRSNFPRCVDVILGQEGGFSNRSDDPGGATNLGITIGTLTAW
jgi:peptidoglycan hydrolase-like protein with peptidoglycan-binding domain